jgi:uncharacterized pyridoxal phosphate-containing UPF0001 family protein
MEIPIKFPDERHQIFEAAEAFRQLSTEERINEILGLMAIGFAMVEESPHREAIKRMQQADEDAWQNAQKELFASLGL